MHRSLPFLPRAVTLHLRLTFPYSPPVISNSVQTNVDSYNLCYRQEPAGAGKEYNISREAEAKNTPFPPSTGPLSVFSMQHNFHVASTGLRVSIPKKAITSVFVFTLGNCALTMHS
jgi:hypothetical protein